MTIKTDLDKLRFSGTAEITLDIKVPTSTIVLNVAAPLSLKAAVLSHTALKTEAARPATTFTLDEKRERVEIAFAGGEVAAGTVKLGLRWEGALEVSPCGAGSGKVRC